MPEMLEFSDCGDIDQLFRESREYYNDIYIKKMAINSPYYNRVQVESWPLNTSPTMAGFRLGRGWYNPDTPWHEVESGRCEQNSCENNFEMVPRPGSEKYTWRQLTKDLRTDWYCLTDWMYRLFPAEEIDHIMATNAGISQNIHEEFSRANWVGSAGHRWLGVANDESLVSCEIPDDQMFILKEFDGSGEGGYNLGYVYVKLPEDQLENISLLSLDQLDYILSDLQREDDAYRLDISQAAGRPLLEIIVPDPKVPRQMWKYVKEDAGWYNANTDFDDKMLQYSLGIDRIIGNYAFSYDINALRFVVDTDYNSDLPDFDAEDVETWPRLRRVLPYYPVPTEIGCQWKQNPLYKLADFAITVPWINNQMTKWMPPGFTGYNEAQMPVQNFAGEWQWKNPDWECNLKRDKGFFWAQFRMAMQIKDPTMMHCILHRLNRSAILAKAPCSLTPYSPYYSPYSEDCYLCSDVVVENA